MFANPKHKPLPLEAVTLLNEGQVVEAIKVVREAEGLGLRDAKARVDAHIAGEPLLSAQLELRRAAARRKFFLWFLAIDLIIVAAVIYWLNTRSVT
jgi:hypothetical protein